MKIIIACIDADLAFLLDHEFSRIKRDDVEIYRGSIFDLDVEAYVSPANSFGFMDGGIDQLYLDHFGKDLQKAVQDSIQSNYPSGELLVGLAIVVPIPGHEGKDLIVAPTMRVPMRLPDGSINSYLATRAAVKAAHYKKLKSIALPGMGTGVGYLEPNHAAHQMAKGIDDAFSHRRYSNWREAFLDQGRIAKSRVIEWNEFYIARDVSRH